MSQVVGHISNIPNDAMFSTRYFKKTYSIAIFIRISHIFYSHYNSWFQKYWIYHHTQVDDDEQKIETRNSRSAGK
jgi:hypothetical protein